MQQSPSILCIETSTEVCSVALTDRTGREYLHEIDEANQHSKELAVMIREVLTEADMETRDLDAVSVSIGPGSYTGLRVGLATAKAICYVHEIPIIGLGSLDILAQAGKETEVDYIIPMIDARRMEVYTSVFNPASELVSGPQALILGPDSFLDLLPENSSVLLLGNGSVKAFPVLTFNQKKQGATKTSAKHMIGLSRKRFSKEQFDDLNALSPQYLKSPNITQPKKKL